MLLEILTWTIIVQKYSNIKWPTAAIVSSSTVCFTTNIHGGILDLFFNSRKCDPVAWTP